MFQFNIVADVVQMIELGTSVGDGNDSAILRTRRIGSLFQVYSDMEGKRRMLWVIDSIESTCGLCAAACSRWQESTLSTPTQANLLTINNPFRRFGMSFWIVWRHSGLVVSRFLLLGWGWHCWTKVEGGRGLSPFNSFKMGWCRSLIDYNDSTMLRDRMYRSGIGRIASTRMTPEGMVGVSSSTAATSATAGINVQEVRWLWLLLLR